MLKLICKAAGALLILLTGGALGWQKGGAAMRRVQVLTDMCVFLEAVRCELHYRRGRTEEILAAAQKSARLTALPLYFGALGSGCGLQTQLDAALLRTEREIESVTQAGERAVLRAALEDLGAYPAPEEEQRLAGAVETLRRALETARGEAAQQRRLYRTVGLSLGGAAALLLL